MYQVQPLILGKDDLWSKGTIQQVYLSDNEMMLLFCLGRMRGGHWEPLRVQGKIAYAYQSEAYAQELCTQQMRLTRLRKNVLIEGTRALAPAS